MLGPGEIANIPTGKIDDREWFAAPHNDTRSRRFHFFIAPKTCGERRDGRKPNDRDMILMMRSKFAKVIAAFRSVASSPSGNGPTKIEESTRKIKRPDSRRHPASPPLTKKTHAFRCYEVF
jgi:hypothetical protein